MLSAGGAGEVPISISGDPDRPERLVHTVRAVGLATEAICAAEPGRRARRAGAVRRAVAGRAGRGRGCRDRRRRDRPRAAAAGDPVAARASRALRPARAALRRPRARPAALHRRARRLGGTRPRGPGHGRQRRARSGSATSASSPGSSAAPGSIRRRHGRDGVRPRGDDALHGRGAARGRRRRRPRCTSRWSATCSAGSATAAIASSARRSCAATGPVYRWSELEPWLAIREL